MLDNCLGYFNIALGFGGPSGIRKPFSSFLFREKVFTTDSSNSKSILLRKVGKSYPS
jgi:hypothetical protein